MAIIRWNPLNLSSLLDDDWEVPTFPGISRLGQGLNLYETENSLVAEAALPGIKEEDIDVSIEKGVVRVSASSKTSQEEKDQRRYFMSSMATTYNYSFRLPEGVDEEIEPTAELENGILSLSFPKVEQKPPKKIAVVNKKKA